MYRLTYIQTALLGVVGWKNSYNPAEAIDTNLSDSQSGLFFQDAHPLLTIDNMRAIMPDDWGYQYPEWTNILEVKKDMVVSYTVQNIKKYFKAKIDSIGQAPAVSSYYEKYDILSDFLKQLTMSGIATMIQQFTQIKQLNKETHDILDHRTLFDGAGRIKATLQRNHKLVGFEFVPIRSMGVTTKIERIGLQMYGGTGIVKMYLFHSSQINPIKTFELNFTVTNGGFQWFNVQDLYLPYISDAISPGGSWFLCYNQDELPIGMEAINVSKDWSREPCGTCNIGSLETWRELTKYLQVTPFMYNSPDTFADFPELWDISQTMYTNTQNYGLNCELTIGCDLTDFIVKQKGIFANVLQKQVAAIALRTLAMNPNVRVNRNQVNASRADILYELDGNTTGVRPNGLGYELKNAYKALSLDTSGLDRVCMSCNNRGIKFRAI